MKKLLLFAASVAVLLSCGKEPVEFLSPEGSHITGSQTKYASYRKINSYVEFNNSPGGNYDIYWEIASISFINGASCVNAKVEKGDSGFIYMGNSGYFNEQFTGHIINDKFLNFSTDNTDRIEVVLCYLQEVDYLSPGFNITIEVRGENNILLGDTTFFHTGIMDEITIPVDISGTTPQADYTVNIKAEPREEGIIINASMDFVCNTGYYDECYNIGINHIRFIGGNWNQSIIGVINSPGYFYGEAGQRNLLTNRALTFGGDDLQSIEIAYGMLFDVDYDPAVFKVTTQVTGDNGTVIASNVTYKNGNYDYNNDDSDDFKTIVDMSSVPPQLNYNVNIYIEAVEMQGVEKTFNVTLTLKNSSSESSVYIASEIGKMTVNGRGCWKKDIDLGQDFLEFNSEGLAPGESESFQMLSNEKIIGRADNVGGVTIFFGHIVDIDDYDTMFKITSRIKDTSGLLLGESVTYTSGFNIIEAEVWRQNTTSHPRPDTYPNLSQYDIEILAERL